MEVFSLRKLVKGREVRITSTTNVRSTTISTTAPCFSDERNVGGGEGGGSDDEGPFYDLEFAAPLDSGDLQELSTSVSSWGHRLSPSSTSLTEEILFNRHLFSVESSSSSPSSLFFSPAASELPASLPNSATKLRIFMFQPSSKIVSNSASFANKFIKVERKVYKDVILRYIRKMKPLYVKISKLSFSAPLDRKKERSTGRHGTWVKKQNKVTENGIPSRFKVVPGLLRKSRSASSAVASAFSPPMMTPRRDDSLLQQEDGIKAAIAHCKRSFHSERELWTTESPLLRSMSDPGGERSVGHGRSQGVRGGDSTVR